MKNILVFFLGILIIIFSNTIFNFIDIPIKINIILIYVLLFCVYLDSKDYQIVSISTMLGYIQDSTTSMYQAENSILFFVFSICILFIRNGIRRDYFWAVFTILDIFLLISAIYYSILTSLADKIGIISTIKFNIIYILINFIVLAISIKAINGFISFRRDR